MTDAVENRDVRRAVEAFATRPEQATMLEVLRQCLHGELLLDVTGSDLHVKGGSIEAGSSLRINSARGPDGGPALLAFTSNAEIERIHPGEQYRSLVQASVDVLGLAHATEGSWLYLDPAGPTCALMHSDLDFALRIARNDKLAAAVRAADADPGRRRDVLNALATDGTVLLALDDHDQLRSVTGPDGTRALCVYTSGPEIVVGHAGDGIGTHSTTEVRALAAASGCGALLVNPAGPSALVHLSELDEQSAPEHS